MLCYSQRHQELIKDIKLDHVLTETDSPYLAMTKEENEKIEIAQYVIKEINKFETEAIKAQLEEAKKIYDAGLEGLYDLEVPSMKAA